MSAKPTSNSARSNSLARGGSLTVRSLDWTGWISCLLLRVRPDQRDFVATNLSSLIQSLTDRSAHALAIHSGSRMVGFALVALEPHERVWWICRLMIDRDAQGLGFGRAAMTRILERLKRAPGCDRVLIGHHPANGTAQRLYLSLGFRPTGRRLGIEEILELRFTPASL